MLAENEETIGKYKKKLQKFSMKLWSRVLKNE